MNRREFTEQTSKMIFGSGIALSFPSCLGTNTKNQNHMFFKISLAQWSLHRSLRDGKYTTLEFPAKAKNDFDIHAIEYVNQFFLDKAKDQTFLKELKQRTNDLNVENVLIMIDAEGELGDQNEQRRSKSVENHYKWVEAAQFLGCHAIRVNAAGEGSKIDVAKAASDSLFQLSKFAEDYGINVIVENHGGYSSQGEWLADIMQKIKLDNCGTLPDFGNFYEYDRYQGVKEMMPFAKGVSAKSNNFNDHGNEVETDYVKMLRIVKDAGYQGYIGIEYEGPDADEDKGIRLTKELLIKAAKELT